MDPSVCRLHPGVAVTGCCPACLRDRLAGLQPPSSADLRRCKSFSYSRSAAAASLVHSQLEPQRRSCDLFRQEQQPVIAVPEEEEEFRRRMEAEEPSRKSSSSFGGLLGKKLQQWRRSKKTKEPPMPVPEEESFRDLDPASSWDAPPPLSGPMFDRLPPAMMEEEYMPAAAAVPRSDGQIPVEEDYYYNASVPGGCAQTRDYYLDSSSSSRRRRSVDRSTTSARNSFSDVINGELPSSRMATNANARVSPAIAAEFYHAHHQSSVLVHHHHQYRRDWEQNYNDFSGSGGNFASSFRANKEAVPPANKPNKKGIKGWSIWGLINKKSSSRKPEKADHRSSSFSSAAAPPASVGDQQVEYPWPELRARGYNGQMLRCNSSISARSSFSGGAAMIGGTARRSTSGMELQHVAHGLGRTRRDELLLERNLSTRSFSYSRSGHDHPMGGGNYQFSQPNHNGVLKDRRSSKSKHSALPRKSTLGPYSIDPITRQ